MGMWLNKDQSLNNRTNQKCSVLDVLENTRVSNTEAFFFCVLHYRFIGLHHRRRKTTSMIYNFTGINSEDLPLDVRIEKPKCGNYSAPQCHVRWIVLIGHDSYKRAWQAVHLNNTIFTSAFCIDWNHALWLDENGSIWCYRYQYHVWFFLSQGQSL